MRNSLGVAIPTRKRLDWSKATPGECGFCQQFRPLLDGKCPDCHDADYEEQKEVAYMNRIKELTSANTKLRNELNELKKACKAMINFAKEARYY